MDRKSGVSAGPEYWPIVIPSQSGRPYIHSWKWPSFMKNVCALTSVWRLVPRLQCNSYVTPIFEYVELSIWVSKWKKFPCSNFLEPHLLLNISPEWLCTAFQRSSWTQSFHLCIIELGNELNWTSWERSRSSNLCLEHLKERYIATKMQGSRTGFSVWSPWKHLTIEDGIWRSLRN